MNAAFRRRRMWAAIGKPVPCGGRAFRQAGPVSDCFLLDRRENKGYRRDNLEKAPGTCGRSERQRRG